MLREIVRGHRSREAIDKLDSELFAFEGCPSGKDEVVRIAQPVRSSLVSRSNRKMEGISRAGCDFQSFWGRFAFVLGRGQQARSPSQSEPLLNVVSQTNPECFGSDFYPAPQPELA